jgi:hypothetical protein
VVVNERSLSNRSRDSLPSPSIPEVSAMDRRIAMLDFFVQVNTIKPI